MGNVDNNIFSYAGNFSYCIDLVVVLTTVSARWEQNISIDKNGIAYTRIQNEIILQYTYGAVQINGHQFIRK